MNYYFFPQNEDQFKQDAMGNYVRTIIFNSTDGKIINSFSRRVRKTWTQTCKNNIETDHRIKCLLGSHFEIYSWVVKSKTDFGLDNIFTKVVKSA